MKRIGIFADVSNLYYCIRKKYRGKKLDYRKYYEFIVDFGEISQAIAYGAQIGNEAAGFIHALKAIGFQAKYKVPKQYYEDNKTRRKADWDVGITIDVVNMAERLDIIVLGSADGDLAPLVDWCRQKGIDVIVIACGISRELKDTANEYIEIPESLLEIQNEAPEPAG